MRADDIPVLADVVAQAIKAALQPLRDRIATLEARPVLKYCGPWERGRTYAAGEAVTKAGSLWVAKLNELASEPGEDVIGWQLADGNDAR